MIYLAQTDTTAGFLSQDLNELNLIKNRPLNQPCVITTAKFSILKDFIRVPSKFKNLVRRSKKTSFIYPNKKAVRVVRDHAHSEFLDQIGWAYSTSANLHNQDFDLEFAKSKADIIVGDDFSVSNPSKIFKISKTKIKKVR